MARSTMTVPMTDIQELASALSTLHDDFQGIEKSVSDASGSIGSSDVRDAFHEFATNWKDHRARIVESIAAVQKMAADSHQAFSDKDLDLANTILGKA